MILGITGTNGAGKSTVANYLVSKGFVHLSVRDFIANEVKKRGMQLNRDSLVLVGNILRESFGPTYIIEELIRKANEINKDAVIESIRNPKEAELIKNTPNAFLIGVDSDLKTRFMRIRKRASDIDAVTFEKFVSDEEKERFSSDPTKQNISKCLELSSFLIMNDQTKEELFKKVDKFLESIKSPSDNRRPSWDEYFIEISRVVAKRATCDRGRSGCIITKNKRILVTGYVGAPTGLPHCDDVGHLFSKVIHPNGEEKNHCIRTTHAEQNAICQAAKLGIPIEGSTLYCKMTPCHTCAKMIINAGIKRVVCEKKYQAGEESEKMFRQAGVQLEILNPEVEKY